MKACIVTGSRHGSWVRFGAAIETAISDYDLVIEGGATGVDAMAGEAAQRHGKKLIVMPADWDTHGRAAGPKRNQRMLNGLLKLRDVDGYEIAVLAFHDDLEHSRGTGDMVRRARAAGVRVEVYT